MHFTELFGLDLGDNESTYPSDVKEIFPHNNLGEKIYTYLFQKLSISTF